MTWLKVATIADELGVSSRTVLRWVERGELEALRLPGGQLRIPQSAWMAWQASHMTGHSPPTLAAVEAGGADADG